MISPHKPPSLIFNQAWVYDKVLPEKMANEVWSTCKEMHWGFGWKSDKRKDEEVSQRYWHVDFANSTDAAVPLLKEMWDHLIKGPLKEHYIEMFYRSYANAHTYGCAGEVHRDDGDWTLIYYPDLTWDVLDLGGTQIWSNDKSEITDTVVYKGNRLVAFPGNLPHNMQEVHRDCKKLRYVIVFKCHADEQRTDFYESEV
jgi:hypothetical protein